MSPGPSSPVGSAQSFLVWPLPAGHFEMLAGEATHKHIQTRSPTGDVDGPYRCVPLKEPIVYRGP